MNHVIEKDEDQTIPKRAFQSIHTLIFPFADFFSPLLIDSSFCADGRISFKLLLSSLLSLPIFLLQTGNIIASSVLCNFSVVHSMKLRDVDRYRHGPIVFVAVVLCHDSTDCFFCRSELEDCELVSTCQTFQRRKALGWTNDDR